MDADGRRYRHSVYLTQSGRFVRRDSAFGASNGIVVPSAPSAGQLAPQMKTGLISSDKGRILFRRRTAACPPEALSRRDWQGIQFQNIWTDIPPINSQAQERLGYPTQKPLALLERIIAASSNPGDLVLDPFCGCGTAVHAAQKLGRQWIGIDVTHLAIGLIEKRLRDAFPGIDFTDPGRAGRPRRRPRPRAARPVPRVPVVGAVAGRRAARQRRRRRAPTAASTASSTSARPAARSSRSRPGRTSASR